MSHPFCITGKECNGQFPAHGWPGWNGKSIYVKVFIDNSVMDHKQAVGEAISRWNESPGIGERFFLNPDKGTGGARIEIYERNSNEYPFSSNPTFWGACINYDISGVPLGANPGKIQRSGVYINRSVKDPEYDHWLQVSVHEIGHAFGLADHPDDDINSVMSYKKQGRQLLAPSYEDQMGIAGIYGLKDLFIRPEDLEGIDNVKAIWWFDRYGKTRPVDPDDLEEWERWGRWKFWKQGFTGNTLEKIEKSEVYRVLPRANGMLGFGRTSKALIAGIGFHDWVYR
jgi:hypothetical protein